MVGFPNETHGVFQLKMIILIGVWHGGITIFPETPKMSDNTSQTI